LDSPASYSLADTHIVNQLEQRGGVRWGESARQRARGDDDPVQPRGAPRMEEGVAAQGRVEMTEAVYTPIDKREGGELVATPPDQPAVLTGDGAGSAARKGQCPRGEETGPGEDGQPSAGPAAAGLHHRAPT
jgi:hypothetical protein